jgi:RimJ/RimL family protein N-acetyltransferase
VFPTSLDKTLQGARLTLRAFRSSDMTPRYLNWLNDPEVNQYSRRFNVRTSEADARRYLDGLAPNETVLSIYTSEYGHVGNIKFGPVDTFNCRADISIVIGERQVWGQGIATEAIYLVTKCLFDGGLNRVEAGSANPAFLRVVEKLGWRREGVQRSRVRIGDRFLDWTLMGLLRHEFSAQPSLEARV